jgi:hypothetical protein
MNRVLATVCGLAALTLANSASATVWTSNLEYQGDLVNAKNPIFGTVRVEDGFDNGTAVQVTVTLADPGSLFINTGGPHDPFLYNLTDAATVDVINTVAQNFFDGGRTNPGTFEATPFGTFTNKIGCCSTLIPDQTVVSGWHFEGTGKNKHKVLDYTFVPAHYVERNGAANGIAGPLVFYLHDGAGLTFAGDNPLVDDATGKLLAPGTGHRFFSNSVGAWFAADIFDNRTGLTYNVAAKDAFTSINHSCLTCSAIPEASTWTLMISGLGAVGAILRRRRSLFAI